MGCKVHPIGLRLGIHRKWKSNWYFDSKNYTKFLHLNFDIEKYFKGFLYFYTVKSLLVNCQVIKLPSNQIFIFIFFYRLRKRLKKTKNSIWSIKYWKLNIKKFVINKHKEKLPFIYAKKGSLFTDLNFIVNNIWKKKKNSNKIIINYKKDIIISYILKLYDLFKIYYNIILKIKKILNIHNILSSFLVRYLYKLNLLYKYNLLLTFLIKKYYLKKNEILNIWIKKINYLLNKNCNMYNQYNYTILLKTNTNTKFNAKSFRFLYKLKNKLYTIKKKAKFNFIKNDLVFLKNHISNQKKIKNNIILNKANKILIPDIKKFLSLITNSKINLIFINSLSFCKFYYFSQKKKRSHSIDRFTLWPLERYLFNRYKYSAIYIKDFIHLSFITILLKNPQILVNFIGRQFKHLPKNRKQLKLLSFITQTIKIVCELRTEIIGFKLQIKGRLNRRNRTKTYNFKKGRMPIQTIDTRVEYGYSEGFTRRGLIGIKFWIFYNKVFKNKLRLKFLEYFLYSKYKIKYNYVLYIRKFLKFVYE